MCFEAYAFVVHVREVGAVFASCVSVFVGLLAEWMVKWTMKDLYMFCFVDVKVHGSTKRLYFSRN